MTAPPADGMPAKAVQWPADGVAELGRCPLCGEARRALFLDGLRDTTFDTAPGEWSLWRCKGCETLYLDPQPTPETIGLAYQNYYTHEAEPDAAAEPAPPRTLPGRLRAALVGRLSHREPAYVERLPLPADVARPRLLDVGCGNGEFLGRAIRAGWEGFGCDFDPEAVAAARATGAEVRQGGAEAFAEQTGSFDAVTLSHVIEHVHDPADLLERCFRLLKPGGRIFIDTPNAEARGLALFGASWRGLEPPRHLMLFNWAGLERMLSDAGFESFERMPQRGLALSLWMMSDRIARGHGPYAPVSASRRLLALIPLLAWVPERRTEFVTLRARRPAA